MDKEPMMATVLLIVRPFEAFCVGDLITGTQAMSAVLNGPFASDVIQVAAPWCKTEEQKEI